MTVRSNRLFDVQAQGRKVTEEMLEEGSKDALQDMKESFRGTLDDVNRGLDMAATSPGGVGSSSTQAESQQEETARTTGDPTSSRGEVETSTMGQAVAKVPEAQESASFH